MNEIISCKNCGASEFKKQPDGTLVCQYCGSVAEPKINPVEHENSMFYEGYVHSLNKWKRGRNIRLIVLGIAMFMCGIFMEYDFTGLGAVTFLVCSVYSFGGAIVTASKKPEMPHESNTVSKLGTILGTYGLFFLAFWLGLISVAIFVVTVIE